MARNSEKAASMLYRFREAQAADLGIVDLGRSRRPTQPNTINEIPICERWRGQVVKDISYKVTKIQDESLADHHVRELNDEINKLMHEKYRWERRIRALGGPNYMRSAGGIVAADGREIVPAATRGYRYFGRAKDLPGVKELFDAASKEATSKTDRTTKQQQQVRQRAELRRAIDAAYYGFSQRNEDDNLLQFEARRERQNQEAIEAKSKFGVDAGSSWQPIPGDTGDGVVWDLPTLDVVQTELVERKKRKLLESLGAI